MVIRRLVMAKRFLWSMFAVVFVAPALWADEPALIPRTILFGNPERTSPQLSPDGKALAYIAPDDKDVLQVWVKGEGDNEARKVTADKKRGIRSYFWTYEPDTLVYSQDTEGDENFHLIAVNVKTGVVRDLTPFQGVRAMLIDVDASAPSEILVGLNVKDKKKFDV